MARTRGFRRAAPRPQSGGGVCTIRHLARPDQLPAHSVRPARCREEDSRCRAAGVDRLSRRAGDLNAPAMFSRYAPGTELEGFQIGERIHAGAMGYIYTVTRPGAEFPMIMKVPRVGQGESGEGLLGFETEAMILPSLSGPHVPRFVAVGDLSRTPYL